MTKNKLKMATRAAAQPGSKELEQPLKLIGLGHFQEAEVLLRQLLVRFPQYGFCHKLLGAALSQQGRLADAVQSMQRAAALLPDDFETHYNLAVLLKQNDQMLAAEKAYRQVLVQHPGFALAHHGVGLVVEAQGRHQEAELHYRQALKYKPDFPEAQDSLSKLLLSRGDWMAGLRLANQYLQTDSTSVKARNLFVQCIARVNPQQVNEAIQANLIQALTVPWCGPEALVATCVNIIKSNALIRQGITQASTAWHERIQSVDMAPPSLAAAITHPLLRAVLAVAPLGDMGLERFLTMLRKMLLVRAQHEEEFVSAVEQDFYCALAQQCFINEYVYDLAADDATQVLAWSDDLAAALRSGAPVAALRLIAVASCRPLHTLPQAELLLQRAWPEALQSLLKMLVAEPVEERGYRATMPKLMEIEDAVSLSVQDQYEENPYPRWIRIFPAQQPLSADDYLRLNFPSADFQSLDKTRELEVLIAGCGTGRHSIGSARKFIDARILAVDLSLTSLSYAKRKTRELGITHIEYAQADILKLGVLSPRTFDIIESGGVLHHMADPWEGWRVLLSLLRPGGFMGLALYSEVARRSVVAGRAFIAERGYPSTLQGIRQCRQEMMDLSPRFEQLLRINDFYSASDCRDLLFHVQEHRMTLPGIAKFLRDHHLNFLGFQLREEVLAAYRARFPHDISATNLDNWAVFEEDHPDTFIGMYQFWFQKPA